ncbi:MAG: DUF1549 domain-containing protein [Gemmataceae bacterium]
MINTFARLAVLALLLGAANSSHAADFFTDRVAPVLRQRCVQCHNPSKARGGLDLTSREGMLKGSDTGPALVPGNAAKSLVIDVVAGPKPRMPKQGGKLTTSEIADLKKWIQDGAVWPKDVLLIDPAKNRAGLDWWSLQPLKAPMTPGVKDKSWIKNLIDSFILATLDAKGLKPSPPADKRTLIRRVTFDLHGLPPTPEEVEAFVNDSSPDAYERLVDRLLASPRYGERWGRHWLDVAHYGDTHGYDKDKRRDNAWRFRDYVIHAFNEDKPYGRFIREQIAGDVLFPNDPEAIIATGFIAAGPWDFVGHVELREGTVDKEKTRLLDRDDMVSTTVGAFLSLTAHCARCHDHKFDPIPQKDYYRLQAVFAGVDRGDRPFASKEILVQRAALTERLRKLTEEQIGLEKKANEVSSPELTEVAQEVKSLQESLDNLPKIAEAESPSNGYHSGIELKADIEKWVQVDLGQSLPVETIQLISARPRDFPDTPGFGFPLRFRVAVSDDASFTKAEVLADQTQVDFPNPGDNPYVVQAGKRSARYVRVTATRLWRRTNDYVFALAELQVQSGGKNVAQKATVTALDSIEGGRWGKKYLVDDFDSRHSLPDRANPKMAALLEKREAVATKIHEAEQRRQKLSDALLDPATRCAREKNAKELSAVNQKLQSLSAPEAVYAITPHAPRPIHVLHRGDVEQPGDLVQAGALSCIKGLKAEFKLAHPDQEGTRRAALANWIANADNPLPWRSIVNRIWHYHFGRGLVDTPNDFGWNGSRPTHPELLDWLAVTFRDKGGSLKKLHRLILRSATYRQASRHDGEAAKIDADNRYLWRMNRQRLDSEETRDAVLAVSGKLNLKMGGPGFELFRFKDDHSPIYDHSDVAKINDPATFRRTIYRFTVRSVPNPFLDCLDGADPNLVTPVRTTTLTALQALALLNDPFMIKQAEYMADRLKKISDNPAKQMEAAYHLLFSRDPKESERDALVGYAKTHGLASACRLLFNANEFVFVD